MAMIGKILGRIAVYVVIMGGVCYLEYRANGGKPIRKVYKEVKDARIKKAVDEAKKAGKIIYIEDYQVV